MKYISSFCVLYAFFVYNIPNSFRSFFICCSYCIVDTFDVTTGAYDGAEICELVGISMLSLLNKTFSSNNIGLYRDDGLSLFRNISGWQAEKHKKRIQKVFKDKGLQIIMKCNLKIVDHLDITLNLNDGTYRPFHKPNEESTHIHVEFEHPLQIIK